jgi:hypothetical protein
LANKGDVMVLPSEGTASAKRFFDADRQNIRGRATPSHLFSEFVDGEDRFTSTPAGLVYKEAPSTLYAADGTKVTAW